MKLDLRQSATALAIVLAGAAFSGCMGPTYGTGKSAGMQLVDDVDGLLALGPTSKDNIDYSPRAELVRPADRNVLPPPQDATDAVNNPNWPESPEARKARIRAAADAKDTDGVVQPGDLMASKEGIGADEKARNTYGKRRGDSVSGILSPAELQSGREGFKQRLAQTKQGSPTDRKYLSEPPVAYRQPAATAPVGDPGEDEEIKQKRLDGKDETLLGRLMKKANPF